MNTISTKPKHKQNEPNIVIDTKKVFNVNIDFEVKGFSKGSDYVP